MKIAHACFLIVTAFGLLGCAGTGTNNRVTFDSARYPVSLSGYVPDSNGAILGPAKLQKLGSFQRRKRAWSTFWGFIPLHRVDFSKDLNATVAQLGGEAVVNLKVTAIDSGVNWWFFLHWFPLWPGNAKVEVQGTVVKRAAVSGNG